MLHERKKTSILSWVQSAGGHDVENISQLANGELLSQLVVTLSDKDCSLSSKADNEPEKVSLETVDDKQHDTKEIVNSSEKEIADNSQEPEIINGYFDSSTDELKPNGVISHSIEPCKTEAEDIAVNGVISESNDSAITEHNSPLLNKFTTNSQDDGKDNDISDSDTKCISVDSFDLAVNGSSKENFRDQSIRENSSMADCSDKDLKVTNSVSYQNSNSLKIVDDYEDYAVSKVQSHYDVVQKFIENMLELDCRTLVDFSQCMEGNELELSKLIVLLLSAMVQYSLSTDKDHIMAPCYSLSQDAQEEIQDCLELFLKDRQSPIEKKEFHSRLSRCAKLRNGEPTVVSPRKHACTVSTPHTNKPARRGRKRKVYNDVEEFCDKVFESPIQTLIKSPNIRHITPNSEARLLDAVRCKDKTIALLTYDLDVEKYNVDDLKKQNEDLAFQLSKLRKEKDKLKKELEEVQTNLENNELSLEKAEKEWKNEVKSYQSQIKDLKEAEKFWKETYQMEDTPSSLKSECSCSEEISSLKCAMLAKDDKIKELQKQIEILTVQIEKLNQERRDLQSQLEDNLNPDDKPSRSSIQEKCFNISDLSLRNELKDKCEELENHLKEQEIEYSVRLQKLEDLLSQKDTVEREWKAKFRKIDKEREDAIKSQKKLEMENSNLKGQIEVFKKIIPDISSQLSPKSLSGSHVTPANRRSSRYRNVCDSEKIGQLWHTYEGEAFDSVDTIDNSNTAGSEQDRPSSESSAVFPPPSESKLLNKKVSEKSLASKKTSEKSPAGKMWRSRSASDVTTSELGDSISTCKVCSQSDFCEVPPLIQNICKIVREDNILDTNMLLELHKYEKDFNMNELVQVLTLLTRILMEERTSNHVPASCFKGKRNSGGLKSDNNSLEKVKMSSANEPEQLHRRDGTILGESSCETTTKSNTVNLYKYQQLLKDEKKKVMCLQSKLKGLKNLLCASEEKIRNLQAQLSRAKELRDTNVERCKKLATDYELMRKELEETKEKLQKEKPAQVIQTVVKTPPPPCENCPKLNEKLISYRIAKEDSVRIISSLKKDIEIQKVENETMKQEICKLYQKKNELEEKLSDPKIVSAGVYSPRLKTLREKFNESRYMDVKSVSDGSEESEYHNASSVTNYSFTAPSVDGFTHSGRNQSKLRAFCKAEDEAEMLSQSSIFRSDTPSERLKEINRRNTLCLPHLKSQYPLELNTTPSQHKYFQPPATPSSSMTSHQESSHLAKKRKISKPPSERLRSSFVSLISNSGSRIHHSSTPKVKKSFTQYMHKTNTSAARLQYRSSKGSIDK